LLGRQGRLLGASPGGLRRAWRSSEVSSSCCQMTSAYAGRSTAYQYDGVRAQQLSLLQPQCALHDSLQLGCGGCLAGSACYCCIQHSSIGCMQMLLGLLTACFVAGWSVFVAACRLLPVSEQPGPSNDCISCGQSLRSGCCPCNREPRRQQVSFCFWWSMLAQRRLGGCSPYQMPPLAGSVSTAWHWRWMGRGRPSKVHQHTVRSTHV
jgi:hypothetical protein